MNSTTSTGNAGSAKEKQRNFSTDTETQRLKILEWLQHKPLTTLQARKELDVMHPAGRVMELKKRGYNIITHWQTVDTGKAKHRVARYVLLARAADDS